MTAPNNDIDATISISVPMGDATLIEFLGLFIANLTVSVALPVIGTALIVN